MPDDQVSTTATTTDVAGIVGPENTTFTTEAHSAAYMVTPHPPTPRGERLSLYGQNPTDVLRAMLRTPHAKD